MECRANVGDLGMQEGKERKKKEKKRKKIQDHSLDKLKRLKYTVAMETVFPRGGRMGTLFATLPECFR